MSCRIRRATVGRPVAVRSQEGYTFFDCFQKGRSTMKCFSGAICSFLAVAVFSVPAVAQQPKIYNTVKLKLAEGKQVFSYTQTKFDIAANCEAASPTPGVSWRREAATPENSASSRRRISRVGISSEKNSTCQPARAAARAM